MQQFKLGFIINPIAGLGGSVALKGSDGMANYALSLGAKPQANARATIALEVLLPYKDNIIIYTANDQMGEQCAKALGFTVEVLYHTQNEMTAAGDSELAAHALLAKNVDIILFAGGDGTARDIATVVTTNNHQPVPVLGIPAGCKIHSAVYAVTPKAAGRVVELMLTHQLVSLTEADVMDIDENLFRQGIVKAKRFGEMQVPTELRYMQAVKSGGKEVDELVLQDIAAYVIEQMDDNLFIIGSGSTTAFLMAELGLENTLLGVDAIYQQNPLALDLSEAQLWQLLEQHADKTVKLVITLIGGQGHIFGRGNQQLSPRIIQRIGLANIMIIATKSKLTELAGRPLLVDTGDQALDQKLSGYLPVITGYNDQVLYPVSSPL